MYNIYYTSLLPSISIDDEVQRQRSTVAFGRPWGGTNEVLLHLAAPRVVQMKILQELCWQCEPLQQQSVAAGSIQQQAAHNSRVPSALLAIMKFKLALGVQLKARVQSKLHLETTWKTS